MTIINGKKIAREILQEQKNIIDQYQLKPNLATILIGNDAPSRIYINEKRKKSKIIGIDFELFELQSNIKQTKVIKLIKKLNDDKKVSAIIVQFPLPKNFDADAIVKTIDPKKDADGFHLENIKKFLGLDDLSGLLHKNLLLPVTPAAIMEILNRVQSNGSKSASDWKPFPRQTAFIGKSSIFTKPLIHYFSRISNIPPIRRARKYLISNFQIIPPNDPKLALKSRSADILITACGKPRFIKANMIKQGAIVIDVGINRFNNKVTGDVDFDSVAPKTSFITAVPGGVGPVTVAVLLRNVVYSALLEKIS